MGKVGVGKTTFYNKLCETEHVAMYSKRSLTRQLFRSEVTHGGNRFTVIDTPGTDSADEVLKHSYLLKEALTYEPVNAIFTLVEYSDRSDSALDEFDRTTAYLKPEYRDMVVVVIAKFDHAPQEQLEEIKADYTTQFKAEGYGRIMFHCVSLDVISVAAGMLGIMSSMPKRQMQYKQAEFLVYFRLADESRVQKQRVRELEGEVRKTLQGYETMLRGLGDVEDKDDLIMSAIASSRYDVERFYDKFIEAHGATMIDLDCYTNSIALQKVVNKAHWGFKEIAKGLMSYNPDDTKDWRNAVRSCQHCGEVWVKVSGCDGETTCGNIDSQQDVTERPFFRYSFHLDAQGRCTWSKNRAGKAFARSDTFAVEALVSSAAQSTVLGGRIEVGSSEEVHRRACIRNALNVLEDRNVFGASGGGGGQQTVGVRLRTAGGSRPAAGGWRPEAGSRTPAAGASGLEQGFGCGRKIIWSEQPRLSRGELEKFLEVRGLDTLISSMQRQPEFRTALNTYLQTIDTSFTS